MVRRRTRAAADRGGASSPRRPPSPSCCCGRRVRPRSSSSPSAAAALAAPGSRRPAQAVVYSEASEGNRLDVWRIHLADGPASGSLRLPGGGDVLATRAARLRCPRIADSCSASASSARWPMAPIGGGRRARWPTTSRMPTGTRGTQLAVAHRPVTAPSRRRSSIPPARVLYKSPGSIRFLRFSPDGQRLAFVQDSSRRGVAGQVAVVDLKGTVTQLTERLGQRARPGVVAGRRRDLVHCRRRPRSGPSAARASRSRERFVWSTRRRDR